MGRVDVDDLGAVGEPDDFDEPADFDEPDGGGQFDDGGAVDDDIDDDDREEYPGEEYPGDDPGGAGPGGGELGEREREVLAFEGRWWRHAGSKEQAIRDRFGVSSTRYYQLLNALLDNPAALAHDPVLVKRLRRLRAVRTRSRSAGRVT